MTRSQLEQIAEQIAEFSLRIDLAKHALLTKLREFDTHEGWANTGFTSTAAWLAWRIQIGITAAREHVRVARRLGELPGVDAAFGTGELSYAKVRAITRAATPEFLRDGTPIPLHRRPRSQGLNRSADRGESGIALQVELLQR